MICILHGYLLEGSGSNLWTRSVVDSLCRQGEIVHLVAQENHPERYDFIAEWRQYPDTGPPETLLTRSVPYPGACILHRPLLGNLLPVYVWDRYEDFSRVVPMVDLSDAEIEDYVERNVEAVMSLTRENRITAIHANHSVLMSVVAERVRERTGIPYSVMPHGSALEFAVKRDERFHRLATGAFDNASRIFVIGEEMRQRVRSTFPARPELELKFTELHLGVDTRRFVPLEPGERREAISRLADAVATMPRGKTPRQTAEMRHELAAGGEGEGRLLEILHAAQHYDGKLPDAGLEERLAAIDWETAPVLLFVGRLISTKGIQSVIAALPLLLQARPDLRIVVVGHGPLREPLEALLWAMEHGDRDLFHLIAGRGVALEGNIEGEGGEAELPEVARFLERLLREGGTEEYFAAARRHVREDSVTFTGYLTHHELRHLFPCADAAIFPSVVREAGPLVFLEALASGVFPLGTYFGGMRVSIDSIADALPPGADEAMKLDPDPAQTVADIVRQVPIALELGAAHKQALHRVARERFDWTSVTRTLLRELEAL